jgi:hypothetical protein
VPLVAREDALKQVLELGVPVQLSANQVFHRLLVGGVPVQYQKDGETRGDFVRLIDWAQVQANDWLAINQFSILGPKHNRRPDIILFINSSCSADNSRYQAQHATTTYNVYYVKLTICSLCLITSGYPRHCSTITADLNQVVIRVAKIYRFNWPNRSSAGNRSVFDHDPLLA